MARDLPHDLIELSSGRKLDFMFGVIGIGPDLDLYEGFDEGLQIADLTPAERVELIDFMIERWQRLKDKQP